MDGIGFLTRKAPMTLGVPSVTHVTSVALITSPTASYYDSSILVVVAFRTTVWLLGAFFSDEFIFQ